MFWQLGGHWSRRLLPLIGAFMAAAILLIPTAQAAALSTVWSVVHSPNVTTGEFANNTFLGVTALSDKDVWAVGFESATGADLSGERPLAEHWNGSAWSVSLAGTQNALLNAVAAASSNDVWAVGYVLVDQASANTASLVEHWNGTTWSVVNVPVPAGTVSSKLLAVTALSATNAWAVGTFSDGVNDFALIEHWNGKAWSVFPDPVLPPEETPTALGTLAAVSANDIWAGPTLHWNGTTWSPVAPAVNINPNAQEEGVVSMSAVSHTDVWGVGEQTILQSNGVSTDVPYTIHWNGSKWTQIPAPVPNNNSVADTLDAVAALSSTDVWAVGTVGGNGFIEHWNGSAWSLASTPALGANGSTLFGIARSATTSLWAVGSTTPVPLTTNTLTIHTTQG